MSSKTSTTPKSLNSKICCLNLSTKIYWLKMRLVGRIYFNMQIHRFKVLIASRTVNSYFFYNFVLYSKCMKPIILILLLFLSFLSLTGWAQEQQVVVPYTLADRDRGIRTETKLENLETKMDVKFEAVNVKFEAANVKFEAVNERFEAVNERFDYLFWLIGVIIALNLFILGYTIWDRRTALQPALDKATGADTKSTNLIRTLREYSKKHPDLAEILKSHGIL